MRGLALAALAAGLALSACATGGQVKPVARNRPPVHTPASRTPLPPVVYGEAPRVAETPPVTAQPERREPPRGAVSVASLQGWADEDHRAGLAAFRAGCGASKDASVRAVCAQARAMGEVDDAQARTFFERNFVAEPVAGDGVLTAYFAPEYEARSAPSAEFSAPVRPRPAGRVAAQTRPSVDLDDLIDVALQNGEDDEEEARGPEWIDLAHADRASIERAAPIGAMAWMRPEDLFFLQIQGSGTLTFPDGRRLKAAYAADNGKPFVAIARPMVERGLFKANGASGDNIRAWLAANRGPKADAVMQLNPRYIFFDLLPDDGREPAGAAGVPLPAGRAIAVDPSRHEYGELYWIDAAAPTLSGAAKVYRRLAMALDTGSAIRGEVRADLYIGRGDAAGAEAGRVRHTLRMVRLIPAETSRSARRETDAPARGG